MITCRQCQERYESADASFCGRCGADLRPLLSLAAGGGAQVALADADEAPRDTMVGRVIGGRYRVLERIGSGGMGVVYKVEHAAMGKVAALKMLHPMLSSERELVKRFRNEARAVSLLTHPNTVQVFDFGEADGCLYMVMELVRGEDLARIVEREGPLPWRRVARLMIQICEALAEAHEAGVVHRDVKPENVFVVRTREGRETVKVLDFGLAKLTERGGDLAATTGGGLVIGTPYYMSPEQIKGEPLDARSDIYSLGATAYDLVTGQHPFDGPSPVQVLTAHLSEPLVPARRRRPDLDIDPRVDALLARCMARSPAGRYGSADELRRAIEELAEASGPMRRGDLTGPQRRDPSLPSVAAVQAVARREDFDQFERGLRRRRWVGLTVALVALGAALAAGAWLLLRGDGERAVTEEREPNNEAAQANLISSGAAVTGRLGKRLGLESSDRDFFYFRVVRGPVLGRLELGGIQGIDLRLSLFDRLGDRVADADAPAGERAVLPNLRLEAGEYFAEVRELRVAGGVASEDSAAPYSLRVTLDPLGPNAESEPDDTPATAQPVTVGTPVAGYLGRAGDVDYYYPRGEPVGPLDGQVSGVPGVDLKVVVLPPGAPLVADPATLPGARVFDAGGVGAGEELRGLAWPGEGGAPLVVVVRKEKDAPRSGSRPAPLPGVDAPYTLTLRRHVDR